MVRDATPEDREWIGNLLRKRWHDTLITAHGELIDVLELPALVVDHRRGLVTWRRVGGGAELMTIDADRMRDRNRADRGIGGAVA